MGYRTSLEYIGENTMDRAACQAAAEELKTMIRELNGAGDRVCFDLSHIGLSVDTDLAYRLLTELAEEARRAEAELLISMEESAKTDRILDVCGRPPPATRTSASRCKRICTAPGRTWRT